MNTPSHHRVHHGVNPRYLDANYAGVFIIWDRMFGSFVVERDDEPVRYGIVKQLGSFNILWAAVHERSEEHTSELQSLMRISYAVFCLKKKITLNHKHIQYE